MVKGPFVIPLSTDRFIVYSPNDGLILLSDGKALQGILSCFPKTEEKQPAIKIDRQKKNRKFGIILCPTNNCNLKCIYCYANGGNSKSCLNWEIAEIAMEFGFSQIIGNGVFELGFHGGGEPFEAFTFIKKCVDYSIRKSKEDKKRLALSSATNGVLNSEQIDWVFQNKIDLTISCDGIPKIQDLQRPLKNGDPSHPFVESTIKRLVKEKHAFSVRATVTEMGVNKMVESIDYFHTLGVERVHFEPVFSCGRCAESRTSAPDAEKFLNNYIRAFELAEQYNMNLYYSGCKFNTLTDTFCGATGQNFFVTAEGYLTSCIEVLSIDDPASEVFIYGKIDAINRSIHYFSNKLEKLRMRTVENLQTCANCSCQVHCAGDCLVKSFRQHGSMFTTGGDRCLINKGLLKYILMRYLTEHPISGYRPSEVLDQTNLRSQQALKRLIENGHS